MIKNIGKHTVKCGDVMNGIEDLMQGEKADIIYSDPPLGKGNLSYWQTINKRHTGQEPVPQDLDAFLKNIFNIYATYGKGILFVEYGIRWRDQIIQMGMAAGYQHLRIIPLQYRSGSKLLPLDLHVFSRTHIQITDEYVRKVSGTHGYATLEAAVTPMSNKNYTILDPCCGMGYTAQIALDTGMRFLGNELNAKRLDKTIKRLEKCTTAH